MIFKCHTGRLWDGVREIALADHEQISPGWKGATPGTTLLPLFLCFFLFSLFPLFCSHSVLPVFCFEYLVNVANHEQISSGCKGSEPGRALVLQFCFLFYATFLCFPCFVLFYVFSFVCRYQCLTHSTKLRRVSSRSVPLFCFLQYLAFNISLLLSIKNRFCIS